MADESNRVPAVQCPGCHATLDGAGGITHDARPSPGDLTVCVYCATILTFQADLTAARLSDAARQALPASVQAELDFMVHTITRLIGRRGQDAPRH